METLYFNEDEKDAITIVGNLYVGNLFRSV